MDFLCRLSLHQDISYQSSLRVHQETLVVGKEDSFQYYQEIHFLRIYLHQVLIDLITSQLIQYLVQSF
jgi:hypothetical protein